MKKKIILILLFIGPLGFFIFLSLGDVNFKPCEIFKENIIDVATFKKDTISFKDNINVITFLGKHPNLKETQLFNLNEVVFKKLDKYKKFQMISFYTNKNNPEIISIKEKLSKTAGDKFYKWKFIHLDSLETLKIYQSLKTINDLDASLSSNKAFIIDKNNNQRGRTDDDKIGEDVFAYDLSSVNDLKNKLLTDTENVFYEQEVSTTSRKERLGKDEK
ncbi:hypothetical protein AXE80_01760 [Wenyingzhuangia fucanilytica]|uniref:Membrane or secreted protein n=1 Tax=Wenyingzhuangia fucanilytica TaxID=1790137 RepID=A0A1B1Y2Z7_9FLAO|nr:hypothetical protein [Wenyingzhuangia fucanilytica]ANW95099.1 hypothetical protein AXE80_01760 [Wenyingzhuangia fucanilytica]